MRKLMDQLVLLLENHPWALPVAIVVLGLLVYGMRDTLRLIPGYGGWTRVWAISSVCFAESIRKRVLWITPLAILGVIIVSQLQRPIDEADTVRQMLKVCLFATGLVVTISAIILACTNLPKEIDNRVIYTIVTKPTTRLEIVLGKILGFARVSATILIIMGLFTAGYLGLTAATLQRGIEQRLSALTDATGAGASIRPTLEYYRDTGLLTARRLGEAQTMQILGRDPALGEQNERWMLGGEGDVFIPFRVNREVLIPPGDGTNTPGSAGVFIEIRVGFDQPRKDPARWGSRLPRTVAAPEDESAPTQAPSPARVSITVLDRYQDMLVTPSSIDRGQPLHLEDPTGARTLSLHIPGEVMGQLDRWEGGVIVAFSPLSPLHDYRLRADSVRLIVPAVAPGEAPRVIEPASPIHEWSFRGRLGRVGAQIRGGQPGKDPTHVALFTFHNAPATPDASGLVPFEFRSDIERSGVDDDEETVTRLHAVVRDRDSGKVSDPILVPLEANRPIFFKAPVEAIGNGNFDVLIRCATTNHYLGLTRSSLHVVRANQGFGFNLSKSLLIMWLMTLLVISVAIFCSTFLSWPIAIVLTIVMLLGRWGVLQLGDALMPGIGNQVATDLGFRDPALTTTVSRSIEALARFLNYSAKVLPDISQFASIEDLERGVAIAPRRVWDSVYVLGGFGVPVVVLAYVFLRNKEVAP